MAVELPATREEYLKSDEYWGGHSFNDQCTNTDEEPLLWDNPLLSDPTEKKMARKCVRACMEEGLHWTRLSRSIDFDAQDYDEGTIIRLNIERKVAYPVANSLPRIELYTDYWSKYYEGIIFERDGQKHILVPIRYEQDYGSYQGDYFPSQFKVGEVRHSKTVPDSPYFQMARVATVEVLETINEDEGEDDEASVICVVATWLFGHLVPQPSPVRVRAL